MTVKIKKSVHKHTKQLTDELVRAASLYIDKRQWRNPDYKLKDFLKETGISRYNWDNIIMGRSFVSLDTYVRTLSRMGLKLDVVPQEMPKELYMHKDIIPPKEYR